MITDDIFGFGPFIRDVTEQEQIKQIERDGGYMIQFIENPSENVQLAAVYKSPQSIEHIKNPTERVQLDAVHRSPHSIGYIKNPTEKVQIAAVTHSWRNVLRIDNPTKKVKFVVLTDIEAIMHPKYNYVVEQLFPNSSILVDKWIKYGERVRKTIKKGKAV